jgi:hypothetical protein
MRMVITGENFTEATSVTYRNRARRTGDRQDCSDHGRWHCYQRRDFYGHYVKRRWSRPGKATLDK